MKWGVGRRETGPWNCSASGGGKEEHTQAAEVSANIPKAFFNLLLLLNLIYLVYSSQLLCRVELSEFPFGKTQALR